MVIIGSFYISIRYLGENPSLKRSSIWFFEADSRSSVPPKVIKFKLKISENRGWILAPLERVVGAL